jgi:hypothetical protein
MNAAHLLLLSTVLLLPLSAQEKEKKKGKNHANPKEPVMKVEEGPDDSGPKKRDPLFDYVHLPPTNEAFWEPLGAAQVDLGKALGIAAEGEGAPIRVLLAEQRQSERGWVWYVQLFVGGSSETRPKRVNLEVSCAEPKVVWRLELLSLAPDELATWESFTHSEVPPDVVQALCLERARPGNAKEDPLPGQEPRVRRLVFQPQGEVPIWSCEVMGFDKDIPRRWGFLVNAVKPRVKQKLMLDRFPGEPLRSGHATELENGLHTFDFITGDGPLVTADSKVKVHYRMFLLDNTKFYDTLKNNQPEVWKVSEAPLRGISEGMAGMRVGGKRKIAIPYTLGFGEQGNEVAPPKAMVVCDISIEELLSE